MVDKCYDFFDCRKTECPMFIEGEERNCWDVPDTSCLLVEDGESLEIDGDQKFFCKNCLYYEHVNKSGN
ncbi:MAG: hypothetical protein P1P81_04060 [Desulfobulbales bacterium]|nr:hypothetical protein [Desulfobulbales bacterium]